MIVVLRMLLLSAGALLSIGCGALINNVTSGLADDLTTAVLSSEDIKVVEEGLPSYLILVDSFVQGDQPSADLLLGAAVLNGSYATAFVEDASRQKHFALKAFDYAQQATCMKIANLCAAKKQDFKDFESRVQSIKLKDIETLYVFGTSWATYIQTHSDDWEAVAELSHVKVLMQHVLDLDETHEQGASHMYMGVFETLFPPSMGGKPEKGREHFERAITLSEGRNLYAKVLLAESYARLVYDRELHDRLVEEILNSSPKAGDFTLQNILAQQLAEELKNSADEYF